MATGSPPMLTNFMGTPLSSLSITSSKSLCTRLNSRNLQSSRIFCDYSCFEVKDLCYRAPGTQINILNNVSFCLPQKSFGLIFGRSGSGKTTLLQLLAGLSKPTSGSILLQGYGEDGRSNQPSELLPPERVGIVFQFPERYFLADTLLDEVTFAWPKQKGGLKTREYLASNLARALNWVGLNGVPFDKDPQSLSGGYKRRLALAIQLIQVPELLILDEPLAGLDWKARADVAKLLKHLKKELTLLVVSHDLNSSTKSARPRHGNRQMHWVANVLASIMNGIC
ncbi:ABC transporter I family member 11, chloroplastic isoform X2 [Amaranthus tricolor]|uniref:ABC transporter I family member 11, chloroplastic isoform X2 n=1 Tax=Amaranthus tricolor TaxID=29722 RepID=UPI0025902A16|nr:ABC transporter I family member 11, chloroplastic isoform X2 [Amaranthus tricolor]